MDHPGSVETIPLDDGNAVALAPLRPEHTDDLWMMFADAVARGEGYPQTPPLTRETFEQTWIRPVTVVVGAVLAGRLVGAYYLKPNQPGLGAHIANAGYLVDRTVRGGGIGRMLVADSIERAPLAGFDAVQFNFVFDSNPARAMYEDLGWREIGRVPDAVPGPRGGRQDAVIYWRAVGPAPGSARTSATTRAAEPAPLAGRPEPDPSPAQPAPHVTPVLHPTPVPHTTQSLHTVSSRPDGARWAQGGDPDRSGLRRWSDGAPERRHTGNGVTGNQATTAPTNGSAPPPAPVPAAPRPSANGRTPPHAGHRAAVTDGPAPAGPDPARLHRDIDRILGSVGDDDLRATIDRVLRSYTDGD